jgi:hypothetical protein
MSNQRVNDSGATAARFRAEELFRFGKALLVSAGLPEERAHAVAEVLLEGDLLGHTTHGFALLPLYLKSLAEGGMEKEGEPEIISDHGSAFTWQGRYLPGPWLVAGHCARAGARKNTSRGHGGDPAIASHRMLAGIFETGDGRGLSDFAFVLGSGESHGHAAWRCRAAIQP